MPIASLSRASTSIPGYRNEEKTKNISVMSLILSVVTCGEALVTNVEAQRKALSRIQFERERDDTRKGKKKAREGWGEKERRAERAQHDHERHSTEREPLS